MPPETREDYPRGLFQPRWPIQFTKRREFDRPAENISYVHYLRTPKYLGEEDDDDRSSEEEDDEDDDSSSEIADDDRVNDESAENEDEDEDVKDDKDAESYAEKSDTRLFMEGMDGDHALLKYRDQVDQVAGFYEHAIAMELEPEMKCVALIDERNIGGTTADKKGHRRPDSGPMTAQELSEKLGRERFPVKTEGVQATNAFDEEQGDADRLLVFITNLDAPSIGALATRTSRTQASALQNLFYNHLMGKTSIGVTIKSRGFIDFALDFHIPFFVLREKDKSQKDFRLKPDGEPLRQCWELPILTVPLASATGTEGIYCLYDNQISVVVTGIDHWVWAAYCCVDTYFDSEETVERYHQWNGTEGRIKGRPDPLAAGLINADEPIWTPREYYFRVVESRMRQVCREWNDIFDKVEKCVKRTTHVFPLSSHDPEARERVRKFSVWNGQMVRLLRQLNRRLSDTVETWDKFRKREIWYFLDEGKRSDVSPSIDAVDNRFSELRDILRKLKALEKELREDNPQGVNAQLGFENNEATHFQQRAARHLEVLTVVMIVFFPLALTAGLFSTTGVLPFTPNLTKFVYVLISVAILILMTLMVLTWRFWLGLILKCSQQVAVFCSQHLNREKVHRSVPIVSPRLLKRKVFFKRGRKARHSQAWDVERGTEKAKAG